MMLRRDEKKQVKEILKLLEEQDILHLARTITLNRLDPESGKEAVDIILRYESSLKCFLQHKKVSREVLFQFMHCKKIPVLPKDDKKSMITKIIRYFEQKSPLPPPKDEDTKQRSVKSETVINGSVDYQEQTVPASTSANTELTMQCRRTEGNVNDLAVEFSKWFYSLMNQESCIGIQHFWADCRIRVHVLAEEDSIDESIAGNAEESVQLLWEVKMKYRLFFNPNITAEGVRGIAEMHGLVMILACGSLHQEQKCVGIFEQKFGLIRDPSAQNNWKIKFTELFLRSTNTVKALPTLQESELINNSSLTPAY